jgi:hypothetical protein
MAGTADRSNQPPRHGKRTASSSKRGRGGIYRKPVLQHGNTTSAFGRVTGIPERRPYTSQPPSDGRHGRTLLSLSPIVLRLTRRSAPAPISVDETADNLEFSLFADHEEEGSRFVDCSRPPIQGDNPSHRPIHVDKWGQSDSANGPSYAKRCPKTGKIKGDTRAEMDYLADDNQRIKDFDALYKSIYQFANHYFDFELPSESAKERYLLKLGKDVSNEFVRFAGFIAVGGPCGIHGWEELFIKEDLRVSLITGVIWKVLKEHVFAHLMFGGTSNQTAALEDAEQAFQKTTMAIDG